MTPTNWNIFEQCFICKVDFDPDDLEEIDDKKYCSKCAKNVRTSLTHRCAKCDGEFPESEMEKYYGDLYCKTCKNLEKKKRTKKNRSKINNSIEFSASKSYDLIDPSIKNQLENNTKNIDFLRNEILFLRGEFIKSKNQQIPLTSSTTNQKKKFDYIRDEPEFWKWLSTQDTNNRAVKRYVQHGRKSPMDDMIKMFIKFLHDYNYSI